MKSTTYRAKLYTPMFFASREGRVTETSRYISSTALSHAIGYRYAALEKPYIQIGEESENPSYSHLKDLPIFVTEAEPVDVSITEKTFRSTTYTSERNITSTDEDVAKMMGNTKGVPERAGKSMSGWHRVREYVGAEPGSEYEFTIFTDGVEIPDRIRFRIGIGRTGEMVAERTTESDNVAINEYLLSEVYGLSDDELMNVLKNCESYERGTDPRLNRFVDVDMNYIKSELIEKIE
jgi:CRISPR-associated protein Csc1